ncbi:EamA/RhaT family transporter [Streptomyces sp. NPDC001165]|uniref:EamA/RhaT family transporter n=1 Tax=Streptomyces sp. NPDC001165 TaxID=3364546 RepID=UPI00369705C0
MRTGIAHRTPAPRTLRERLRPGTVGPLLVFAYCAVNAGKSVLEGALLHRMTPEFLAFNAFLLTQMWSLCALRDRRVLWRAVRRSFADVLAYNVTTAISWLAVLYALARLEPAVANALAVGLVPAGTLILARWLRPQSPPVPLERVAAAGMLGAMAWLGWLAWQDQDGAGTTTADFAIGLGACAVTALSVAGNTHISRRLSEAGMSVGQMMASRFYLLLVSCFVVLWLSGDLGQYTNHRLIPLTLLCGLVVLVALYLLQQGIVRTEPITVSFLLATNLVLTYFFQFLDPHIEQSWPELFALVLVMAFMALGVLGRQRTETEAPSPTDEGRRKRSDACHQAVRLQSDRNDHTLRSRGQGGR